MPPDVKLEINSDDFRKSLEKYATTTKLSLDEIVNTAAMHLAYQAAFRTHHADQSKIAALKYEKSIEIAGFTKTGKYRMFKRFDLIKSESRRRERTTEEATSAALMIYIGKKNSKNKGSLRGRGISPRSFADRKALMDAALRMVNARMSSVHWLRSGWLAAGDYFRSYVGGTTGIDRKSIPRKRAGLGGGEISAGGKATAWIWNSSLFNKGSKEAAAGLVQFAKEGLQAALAFSQQKLIQIAQERLDRNAANHNNRR